MRLAILFALAALACAAPATTKTRYDGHKVLRLHPTCAEDVQFLEQMRESAFLELDFWTDPTLGQSADVHVKPASEAEFITLLQERGIEYEVMTDNIQKLIDDEETSNFLARAAMVKRAGTTYGVLDSYARMPEIDAWYDSMAAQYSNLASLTSIGSSYEGRDMRVMKISSGSGRPAIFLDSGIHAREWITIPTMNWITNQLLTQYGRDATVTSLVDRFDWYILPVANPDGYEYTHTNDRLWRKTRAPNRGWPCAGADPNRNFATNFGGEGTSSFPCSDIYHGGSAFSQKETANMRDFIMSIKSNLIAYISLHSYTQLFMVPWGYTSRRPTDYVELDRVANLGAAAIEGVNGLKFTVGSPAVILYAASGGSFDWAYDQGIKYSYTLELRPDDKAFNGFVIPASNIEPSGKEVFAGIVTVANNIRV